MSDERIVRQDTPGDGWHTEYGTGGGGGSQPVTRELVTGNQVTIDNNNTGVLTWDNQDSGSDLLDLSDPENPAVIAAGTYAVTVAMQPEAPMTADGSFQVTLHLDYNGDDANVRVTAAPAVAQKLQPWVAVSLTYYLPAGGVIFVEVDNNDGVQSLPFSLDNAIVQRLS